MTNRYKIYNPQTGQAYELTDGDLSEKGFTLQEWLERKANVYGESPNVTTEDMTPEIEKAADFAEQEQQAITRLKNQWQTDALNPNEKALVILLRGLRKDLNEVMEI